MSCIVLEPRLERRLKIVAEPIDLVDHEGNVLGVFTPICEYRPVSTTEEEVDYRPTVETKLDELLAAWETTSGSLT